MPFILNCLAALLVLSANASVAADAVAIGGAVERFLAERMTALPGEGSFSVGRFNADRLAGDCEGYEVSMDPGARLWGRTQVAVRCRGAGWRIWVPVQIRVVGDYLVAAQPIAAGRTLGEADLGKQRGDLAELPAGVLLDPSHAVGRAAIGAIPAGRPLRSAAQTAQLAAKGRDAVMYDNERRLRAPFLSVGAELFLLCWIFGLSLPIL